MRNAIKSRRRNKPENKPEKPPKPYDEGWRGRSAKRKPPKGTGESRRSGV